MPLPRLYESAYLSHAYIDATQTFYEEDFHRIHETFTDLRGEEIPSGVRETKPVYVQTFV